MSRTARSESSKASSASSSRQPSRAAKSEYNFSDSKFRGQDLKDMATVATEWAKANPLLATTAFVGLGLGAGALLRMIGFRRIFGTAKTFALPAIVGYVGEEMGKRRMRKKYH